MSVNKVILVGNVGNEVKTQYLTNGDAVANASIATNEKWKDKAGEKHERTEWHRVIFYRRLAELAGEFLRKGSQVYIEGKLQTRKYQDKEGKDRYATEIICQHMQFLSGKQQEEEQHEEQSTTETLETPEPKGKTAFDEFEDDVPF